MASTRHGYAATDQTAMTDSNKRAQARRQVGRLVRFSAYGFAVAGLFVWLVMEKPAIGAVLLLVAAGDWIAARLIERQTGRGND